MARKPRLLTACNCSICRRYAAQWAYTTTACVRVIALPGAMAVYRYASRRSFAYYHCRRCGCVTHYRRVGTYDDTRIAVNARMMDPDDLVGVKVRRLDVRNKR